MKINPDPSGCGLDHGWEMAPKAPRGQLLAVGSPSHRASLLLQALVFHASSHTLSDFAKPNGRPGDGESDEEEGSDPPSSALTQKNLLLQFAFKMPGTARGLPR